MLQESSIIVLRRSIYNSFFMAVCRSYYLILVTYLTECSTGNVIVSYLMKIDFL